jgi:hypothetical protein
MIRKNVTSTAVAALSLGLIAAACGSSTSKGASTGGGASGSAKCPTNLVIQTDWWPEAEHGGSYQLIGAGGTSDAKNFTYKGAIAAKYKVGGIETVEIRAGGDAIQFQPVAAVMKTDPNIYLGYVNTDDVISKAGTVKVTGVAGTLEKNPQMIMWDPAQTKIDKKDPKSIAASGKRILHFPETTYIDWMTAKGYMTAKQSDANYKGSPDEWVANTGNFIQQGFATNEVYAYTKETKGWNKPIDFVLIDDLGWKPYPAMYTVLNERIKTDAGCLKALVPKLQQAWVDFIADPVPTNAELTKIAASYNNYWKVSDALSADGMALAKTTGITSNGADKTYGNFDEKRVGDMLTELKPILAAKNITLPAGYTIKDVVTNEFIDKSIGIK